MTIDFILVCLQTLILSLYGATGLVQAATKNHKYWIGVCATFLIASMACIFMELYVKSNIQLILMGLVVLAYLLDTLSKRNENLVRPIVLTGIIQMAWVAMYFYLELHIIWLIVPVVFVLLFGVFNNLLSYIQSVQEYSLRAGILITFLLLTEPMIQKVMQNLKPVATIPLSSIINQYNILLLGGLTLLVLGSFFWQEKLRH